jgi:hypothetical protein
MSCLIEEWEREHSTAFNATIRSSFISPASSSSPLSRGQPLVPSPGTARPTPEEHPAPQGVKGSGAGITPTPAGGGAPEPPSHSPEISQLYCENFALAYQHISYLHSNITCYLPSITYQIASYYQDITENSK